MKFTDKSKDIAVLSIAILWAVIIIVAVMGYGFEAMFIGVIIVSLHFVLGLSEDEIINKKLFYGIYLFWAIQFGIGLSGMIYFSKLYGDNIPETLIFTMHPSYFFDVAFYWLGTLFTIGVGLYRLKDVWLPQERWDSFVEMINKNKEEEV